MMRTTRWRARWINRPGAWNMPVGLKAGEGHPRESGVLQSLNVLFDVGVGTHGGVQFDRACLGVGVEAPVAELETREQAPLCAWVEGLTSNDQAGPFGQLVIVDQ